MHDYQLQTCSSPFCVPLISTLKQFSTTGENFFLTCGKQRVWNNLYLKTVISALLSVMPCKRLEWSCCVPWTGYARASLDKAKSEIISSSSFIQVILANSLYYFELACFTELFCFSWEPSLSVCTCVEGQAGKEERCFAIHVHCTQRHDSHCTEFNRK